ncbi:hypothetical protein EYF80_012164 [Liparis tanakae]|uniref:Uncharacterized protein n=1 Tax=Liparis tanakae TaxID=230148 RepID=A0A4Z2IJE4_9TELE|nr:hypothetical protein EYF80_012164 [Liparis tanakae]
MAVLAEDGNTSRLPLRRPNAKRSVLTDVNRKGSPEERTGPALRTAFNIHLLIGAIFAVLISVTDPLLHQTLLAPGAAVFGGAVRRVGAAVLIRAVLAVWVTIAKHRVRHTLATDALELGVTAAHKGGINSSPVAIMFVVLFRST